MNEGEVLAYDSRLSELKRSTGTIEVGHDGAGSSNPPTSAQRGSTVGSRSSLSCPYHPFHCAVDVAATAQHHLDIGRGFVIHTQMWAPALAAFACCAIYRIPLSFLGFHWPGGRAMAWGYLLPVAYATIAYLLVWFTGLAPADFAGFAQASQKSLQIGAGAGELNAVLIMTFGVLQSAVSATGEELVGGDFFASFSATPQLYWRSFGQWCHLGTLALPSYPLRHVQQRGTKVGGSPMLHDHDFRHRRHSGMATPKEWLRFASALLHVCHNAVIQWLFDSMTVETGRAAWLAGEFGVALAVISILFAIPIWRNGAATLALLIAVIGAPHSLCQRIYQTARRWTGSVKSRNQVAKPGHFAHCGVFERNGDVMPTIANGPAPLTRRLQFFARRHATIPTLGGGLLCIQ